MSFRDKMLQLTGGIDKDSGLLNGKGIDPFSKVMVVNDVTRTRP